MPIEDKINYKEFALKKIEEDISNKNYSKLYSHTNSRFPLKQRELNLLIEILKKKKYKTEIRQNIFGVNYLYICTQNCKKITNLY